MTSVSLSCISTPPATSRWLPSTIMSGALTRLPPLANVVATFSLSKKRAVVTGLGAGAGAAAWPLAGAWVRTGVCAFTTTAMETTVSSATRNFIRSSFNNVHGSLDGSAKLDAREPVHAHRGVVEHRRALRLRVRLRVLLEVIPDHRVRGRFLVRREVALEHAAVRCEHLDGLVPPPSVLLDQFVRGRRLRTLVPAEAVEVVHAEAAHLDGDVQ